MEAPEKILVDAPVRTVHAVDTVLQQLAGDIEARAATYRALGLESAALQAEFDARMGGLMTVYGMPLKHAEWSGFTELPLKEHEVVPPDDAVVALATALHGQYFDDIVVWDSRQLGEALYMGIVQEGKKKTYFRIAHWGPQLTEPQPPTSASAFTVTPVAAPTRMMHAGGGAEPRTSLRRRTGKMVNAFLESNYAIPTIWVVFISSILLLVLLPHGAGIAVGVVLLIVLITLLRKV